MIRTVRAAKNINRAIDRLELDRNPREALALADVALSMLAGSAGTLSAIHRGRAHQVRAESHLALGELDEALLDYEKAASALEGSRTLYLRCCHDAAITLANMGLSGQALGYVNKGKRALGPPSTARFRDDFNRLALELEPVDADNYRAYSDAMRENAMAAPVAEAAQAPLLRLAHALFEFGSDQELDEALEVVEVLYSGAGSVEKKVAVLAPLAHLAKKPRPMPDTLVQAVDDTAALLPQHATSTLRADLALTYAAIQLCRGDHEPAIAHALDGVAYSTAETWATATSAVRALTGGYRNTAHDVALRCAYAVGDARLAAELIETARLPALPLADAPHETLELSSGLGAAQATRRVLAPLHPVRVEGRSRLAEHYPGELPSSPPIDLEDVIHVVGGDRAWWWGSWLGADGVMFWALRPPNQSWECGIHDDPKTIALLASTVNATSSDGAGALREPLATSYEVEQRLSTALGTALIPPTLAAAARARDRDDPLSLVLASNYLSMIPVALLAVAPLGISAPARLLEGALIRVCPPAALVAAIAATPLHEPPPPFPISVTCHDARDDLAYARPTTRTEVLLAGADFCLQRPDAKLATKEGLIRSLQDAAPWSAFVYCGHVESGTLGADLGGGLQLADGVLTADEILAGELDGIRVRMPARVMFSACDSAGSSGAGAGEWLGVAASALRVGARHVLATSWPIWDLPITAEADAVLIEILGNAADVARALRGFQLDCLDRWRRCQCDYSREPLTGEAREPFPLVWAAFQYLGVPDTPPDT